MDATGTGTGSRCSVGCMRWLGASRAEVDTRNRSLTACTLQARWQACVSPWPQEITSQHRAASSIGYQADGEAPSPVNFAPTLSVIDSTISLARQDRGFPPTPPFPQWTFSRNRSRSAAGFFSSFFFPLFNRRRNGVFLGARLPSVYHSWNFDKLAPLVSN